MQFMRDVRPFLGEGFIGNVLYSELCARADTAQPVRVGLISVDKLGSMFLSQVPTPPKLTVSAIADLDPSGARQACATVDWPEDLIAKNPVLR